MKSLKFDLRDIEKAKILCAKEHFKRITQGNVKYEVIDSYEMLMDKVIGK